jgi:hypothetical protein
MREASRKSQRSFECAQDDAAVASFDTETVHALNRHSLAERRDVRV